MIKITEKIKTGRWRQKNGHLMPVSDMTDSHLINSLQMVVRKWKQINPNKPINTSNYKLLYGEARRRGFTISELDEPIKNKNRYDHLEAIPPFEKSKLIDSFESDLDSRNEF